MSFWTTIASGTTTPVEDKTRIPAALADSRCAKARIDIEALARFPANRARTTIGVGERITLTYSLGNAKWTASGGTLDSISGVAVTFIAPDRAASVSIIAAGGGCSVTITFTVIEPAGVLMERASGTVWHVQGIPSIGIKTAVYLLPDTVSFKFIEVIEGDCAALVSGYFAGTRLDGMDHGSRGGGNAAKVSDTVAGKGAKLMLNDHARSGNCHFGTPYAEGSFDWPIPWMYRIGTGTTTVFATVHQRFTIDDTGYMTLSKAGAHGAAALNDPNSNY